MSVIALLGGGTLLLLVVTAFPRLSFLGMTLSGIVALAVLLQAK